MKPPAPLALAADVRAFVEIAGFSGDKALRAALIQWACKVAPGYGEAVRFAEDAYRYINGAAIQVRDVSVIEPEPAPASSEVEKIIMAPEPEAPVPAPEPEPAPELAGPDRAAEAEPYIGVMERKVSTVERIWQLDSRNMTAFEIAAAVGTSITHVYQLCRQQGIPYLSEAAKREREMKARGEVVKKNERARGPWPAELRAEPAPETGDPVPDGRRRFDQKMPRRCTTCMHEVFLATHIDDDTCPTCIESARRHREMQQARAGA